MKKLLGSFIAFLFLISISLPCLAVLSTVKNEGTQDLVKIGSDVEVPAGAHVKSAVAINGSVVVNGSVGEDVVAIGGSVDIKDKAMVGGDVVAIGGKVIKSPGAVVTGSISEISLPGGIGQLSGLTKESVVKGMAFFSFLSFLAFLGLTALLVALFTPQLGVVSVVAEKQWLRSLLWGLLAMILFIPIIIVLVVSLVGIFLIPVWVILAVVAWLFGGVGVSHMVGKKVLYALKLSGRSMMLETLCGVIVLFLVSLVPFIGWLVKFIVCLMGLGSVVLTRFGTKASA